MKKLFLLTLLALPLTLRAQQPTQTVRGQIIDEASQFPLAGANVAILGADPLVGAAADLDGFFELKGVPLGRQTLRVTYLGYEEKIIPNVLVTAGKEVVLNLSLQESVSTMDEVVISAEEQRTPGAVNNEMVTLSARSFDPETTQRFAGSRNDPARMAANFAGVSALSDDRNDIVIRGNSPAGVLWRLDGVDIPNPNHFGSLGATGGPVGMLNNNLLERSDFLTGAWPAEYGNALAGVFDLQMRTGNRHKREYLGQVGFNGFELGAEGPFVPGGGATYLASYRYSVLGAVSALGVDFGTGAAVPQYQDLSFKVDVPTAKSGRFSLFGLGGLSYIELLGSEADSANAFAQEDFDTYFGSDMGVVGFTHLYFFNPQTYGKLIASAQLTAVTTEQDSLDRETRAPGEYFESRLRERRYRLGYVVNRKLNARNTVRVGALADRLGYSYREQIDADGTGLEDELNDDGHSYLYQGYGQWQHRFSDRWTLNAGLHSQYFALSEALAVEPRVGLRWQFRPTQAFSLGGGVYNQMQALPLYFILPEDPAADVSNQDLDFTRSFHGVMGYERALTPTLRLNTEVYYQYIDQVPVEQAASNFSALNVGADFGLPNVDSLVNEGLGRNYGVELTLEKTFSKGYYFLLTGSVFQSEYQGSDEVWRSTAFNGNYVFNALAGKEFPLGEKGTLAFDVRAARAGGRRFTPIDVNASVASDEAVLFEDRAFEDQFDPYFRADFKVTYRRNGRRITQEWFVDLQNVFNTENIFRQSWSRSRQEVVDTYQLGFFPNFQYQIRF